VFLPKRPHEASAILKQLAKEKNWKDFFDVKEKVADLRPTYACTVHKSQGSTYDNVFIDLYSIGKNNKPNEVARLLYVAVTRASNNVYLYGNLPDKYKG
jgi:ATP-dependent exoDNAse (exonuclease V) alpha subunit